MAWYSSRIRGRGTLSLEEELHLSRRAQEGSRDALNKLIEANLVLVLKIALEYRNTGAPLEDLLAEGNLGLVKAARRYDPTHGCKFGTYAGWWIRKAIWNALSKHGGLGRVSSHYQKKLREIQDIERRLESNLGRKPRRDEIGGQLPGGRSRVDQLLSLRQPELSLDAGIRGTDDLRLADRLADCRMTSPEEELIRREERALLLETLGELSDQEREVMALRFGLGGGAPLSLAEAGKLMRLSGERVRQVESQGKARLRRGLLRRHAAERGSIRGADGAAARIENRLCCGEPAQAGLTDTTARTTVRPDAPARATQVACRSW